MNTCYYDFKYPVLHIFKLMSSNLIVWRMHYKGFAMAGFRASQIHLSKVEVLLIGIGPDEVLC